MRILIHDFAGHPFQVQLSRQLARRGHQVRHVYCGSLQTTPRGALQKGKDDPASLAIEGIQLNKPLEKYSFLTRWWQENEYGRLLKEELDRFQPDTVLSANTPLDAQKRLQSACLSRDIRFIFWVQDLIGVATKRLLPDRIPVIGTLVGEYYERLERRLLKKSDALILITEDFLPIMQAYGIRKNRLHVIENWAPLDEVPSRPRVNAWAKKHGLHDKKTLLYAGTLGMKHNPQLLLDLAQHFNHEDAVQVVVVSEGQGADWLNEKLESLDVDNLMIMDFQPYERLPDVLGTADILIAVLEPDAGVFSVPSKVLTYHCASRPLLLAVPSENLAAQIVEGNKTGLCVPPTDSLLFRASAERLVNDNALSQRLGENARQYAEDTFDIESIAEQFEAALSTTPSSSLSSDMPGAETARSGDRTTEAA